MSVRRDMQQGGTQLLKSIPYRYCLSGIQALLSLNVAGVHKATKTRLSHMIPNTQMKWEHPDTDIVNELHTFSLTEYPFPRIV